MKTLKVTKKLVIYEQNSKMLVLKITTELNPSFHLEYY